MLVLQDKGYRLKGEKWALRRQSPSVLDVGKLLTKGENNALPLILPVTNAKGKDTLLPSAFPKQSKLQMMKLVLILLSWMQ